jgi:hypothetical protein
MKRLLEYLLRDLHRRLPSGRAFALYIVTPRQGRHVVRRRLLRSLRRRIAARSLPLLNRHAT